MIRDEYRFAARSTGTGFVITAEPIHPGVTGDLFFFADETGFIRVSVGTPADAQSPIFEDARHLAER